MLKFIFAYRKKRYGHSHCFFAFGAMYNAKMTEQNNMKMSKKMKQILYFNGYVTPMVTYSVIENLK